MSERKQYRAIKGTRDILPPDSALWNWFERNAREVFESFNFREVRLPIFEETTLFARAVGEETDIVNREMFSFEEQAGGELFKAREQLRSAPFFSGNKEMARAMTAFARFFVLRVESAASAGEINFTEETNELFDRFKEVLHRLDSALGTSAEEGEQSALVDMYVDFLKTIARFLPISGNISLRPEATASVVRAYIEHGMHALPWNQKLYYAGPMFRRERPQKGRYRQFYQIGAEVLGWSDAPGIDAEVIEMLMLFFQRVGLTRTALYVNSIGCRDCRPKYVNLLREKLREVKDQLGPDSQRRIETNPLRVLDSKLPDEQPIIETLPRISDHLCESCREHFAKLKEELRLRAISYEENWRLVRGLDYYTRTTFEVIAAGLGSQNAVCGGGRYDGLVELLGGPSTKGIGFAIGVDRAILSIQEGGNLPDLPGLTVFVVWMGANSYPTALAITRKLRDAGFATEVMPDELKFRKTLRIADRLGARYALILGEDEVASRTFTLKRLADAEQKKLTESELLEYLETERKSVCV